MALGNKSAVLILSLFTAFELFLFTHIALAENGSSENLTLVESKEDPCVEEEALENIKDAIRAYLETVEELTKDQDSRYVEIANA